MGRAGRPKGEGGGGIREAGSSSGKKAAADRVVEELIASAKESGELPWTRPWNQTGPPRNALSGREYRGINLMYLSMISSMKGYDSTRWITYKQACEESFQQWRKQQGLPDNKESRKLYKSDPEAYRGLRKGERGAPVIFFSPAPEKKDGEVVLDDRGEPKMRKIRITYAVFNAEQTDLEFPPEDVEERSDAERIEAAEEIVAAYPGAPEIQHGGNEASYSPSEDRIRMPRRERFHADADYYHALFHEMIHSTGHSSRTDRTKGDWGGMGSASYAEEELVAEIGAAMLAAHAGIEVRRENSAAYLRGWMKRLEDDPDLLLRASTKAQTAVDHILGTKFEYSDN